MELTKQQIYFKNNPKQCREIVNGIYGYGYRMSKSPSGNYKYHGAPCLRWYKYDAHTDTIYHIYWDVNNEWHFSHPWLQPYERRLVMLYSNPNLAEAEDSIKKRFHKTVHAPITK